MVLVCASARARALDRARRKQDGRVASRPAQLRQQSRRRSAAARALGGGAPERPPLRGVGAPNRRDGARAPVAPRQARGGSADSKPPAVLDGRGPASSRPPAAWRARRRGVRDGGAGRRARQPAAPRPCGRARPGDAAARPTLLPAACRPREPPAGAAGGPGCPREEGRRRHRGRAAPAAGPHRRCVAPRAALSAAGLQRGVLRGGAARELSATTAHLCELRARPRGEAAARARRRCRAFARPRPTRGAAPRIKSTLVSANAGSSASTGRRLCAAHSVLLLRVLLLGPVLSCLAGSPPGWVPWGPLGTAGLAGAGLRRPFALLPEHVHAATGSPHGLGTGSPLGRNRAGKGAGREARPRARTKGPKELCVCVCVCVYVGVCVMSI
jgi:hypothetical protein